MHGLILGLEKNHDVDRWNFLKAQLNIKISIYEKTCQKKN